MHCHVVVQPWSLPRVPYPFKIEEAMAQGRERKERVYQNSGSSSFSYYFLKQSLDFHKPGLCHITKI